MGVPSTVELRITSVVRNVFVTLKTSVEIASINEVTRMTSVVIDVLVRPKVTVVLSVTMELLVASISDVNVS